MEMPAVNRVQAQVLRGAVGAARIRTAPRRGSGSSTAGRSSCCCPARRARCGRCSRRFSPSGSSRSRGGARLYRRVIKIAGRTESDVEQVAQPVYSTFAAVAAAGLDQHPGRARARSNCTSSVRADAVGDGDATFSTRDGGDRGRRRRATSSAPTGGRSSRSSATCCAQRGMADWRRRVVHRRPGLVAPHGRRREFRLRASAASSATATGEDRAARRVRGDDPRARCGQRAGRPGDGRRDARRARGSTWPSGSPESPVQAEGRRRSRSGPSSSPWRRQSGPQVRRLLFPGGREQVKFQASQAALNLVRRVLEVGRS